MALYKYDGPVYLDGRKVESRLVLYTNASSVERARSNFIHRVGKSYDILYNCISEESSWEAENPTRVCPDCGNLLQDSGDCPLCTNPEYSIYDEMKSLSRVDEEDNIV
jgi:rubrerythrin